MTEIWSRRVFVNPQIRAKVTGLLLYIKTFCIEKVNLVKEEQIFYYISNIDLSEELKLYFVKQFTNFSWTLVAYSFFALW